VLERRVSDEGTIKIRRHAIRLMDWSPTCVQTMPHLGFYSVHVDLVWRSPSVGICIYIDNRVPAIFGYTGQPLAVDAMSVDTVSHMVFLPLFISLSYHGDADSVSGSKLSL
jgi:hypothetical protein